VTVTPPPAHWMLVLVRLTGREASTPSGALAPLPSFCRPFTLSLGIPLPDARQMVQRDSINLLLHIPHLRG
jgi:hypothetical protein